MGKIKKFFIYGQPPRTTSQQKGVRIVRGKPFFYKKKTVQEAEKWFMAGIYSHRPKEPLRGAIHLFTRWTWTHKGEKQRWIRAWKTTKPDTDNIIKILKDCLTKAGYWIDDAQVSAEATEKVWGPNPGVEIVITELDGINEALANVEYAKNDMIVCFSDCNACEETDEKK